MIFSLTKKLFLTSICLSFTSSLWALESLKVGVMAGASAETMKTACALAEKKYNLNIQVKTFTDYQMPNEALNSGDIDANIFQTQAFLEQAINKRNYHISAIANTFIYPMGLFSKKIKNFQDIKDKALILIPIDGSNQARALNLLEKAKLITLKTGVKLATVTDITINSKKLQIKTVDAAQIARSLQDADLAAINNDFVPLAQLSPKDALLLENPKDPSSAPYINVIVAQASDKISPDKKKALEELTHVIQSSEFTAETQKLFPGATPAWK